MKPWFSFEECLFSDNNDIMNHDLINIEFMVDRILICPQIRPFMLERIVDLCYFHSNNLDFRNELLKNCHKCPVLIFRLYKLGVFVINDLVTQICEAKFPILNLYFINESKEFSTIDLNDKIFEGFSKTYLQIDRFKVLTEFGFLPSSIEYCLKYDDIDVFRGLDTSSNVIINWSPFEWSYKPTYLDIFSVSAYFGSIHCFKHLMLNGFEIDDRTKLSSICGGSFEIFHLCHKNNFCRENSINFASAFNRNVILEHLIENGADINFNDLDH